MFCRLCWVSVAVCAIAVGNRGFAEPTDESAPPAEASAKTAEEPAKPANEPAKPAEEPAKPDEAKVESQTHKWEFGISVKAVGGPCTGVAGTFPVPADWPEQQVKLVSEQITPAVQRHGYRQLDGLKQMVFEAPQVPVGGAADCFLTFDITRQSQLPPANTANLLIPKDPPRDVKKFLGPSPLIEATNAKVRGLAREWTEGKETAWEQVKAIQAGVRETVKYEQNPKEKNKGVLVALREGKAEREDLTATFVAVCRAAKIPARMVWAMDYCYAEFYLEEKLEADDTANGEEKPAKDKKGKEAKGPKGNWYPCVVHEEAELGSCKDFRPIMGKGDSFKVPEEKAIQRWINFFLTAKGVGGAKPSAEFRKRNAD